MRLATIRTSHGTRAVRVEGDRCLELPAADVGDLLALPDWRLADTGLEHPLGDVEYAPLVPQPHKIICVGLNYRTHIREMGREVPQYPTLFAKYPEALTGATDPIALPAQANAMDWEAELAVVICNPVRHASAIEAAAAIAGFTVLNDITARDWQYRTPQWLQGKTLETTTPFGPHLVTPDELPGGTAPALSLTCSVDGELVQKAATDDLVFGPVDLIRYISTILTLQPGDVIATGTPGGVGHARQPARYLSDGMRLVTEIGGIGRLDNVVRRQRDGALP